MHGVTDSLRIALSGLQLAQNSLATTSNNVANVNTPGYSRKIVEQEARIVDGRGTGVREVRIARKMDEFLELQIRQQQAALGKSETVTAYADDVQGLIFGNPSDGATGIAGYVDDFAKAVEAAATKPEDTALRAAVSWAAEDLFAQVSGAADIVQTLRRDADRRIQGLIAEINQSLQSIHKLNLDLKRSGDNAELMDQRDILVRDLSYKLDVRTYTHDDGTLAIFTPDGQPLLEHSPRTMIYTPPAVVDRNAPFPAIKVFGENDIDPASGMPFDPTGGRVLVGEGTRANLPAELVAAGGHNAITPTLNNGELGGLLEVRDRILPDLDDQMIEFATLLRHSLNAAHNAANALPLSSTIEGTREVGTMAPSSLSGTAYLLVRDPATPDDAVALAIDVGAIRTAAETIDPVDWPAQVPGVIVTTLDAMLSPHGVDVSTSPSGGVRFAHAGGLELAWSEGSSAIAQSDAAGHELEYGLGHYLGLNDLVATPGDDPTALRLRDDVNSELRLIASAMVDVGALDSAGAPPTADVHLAGIGGVGDNRGLKGLAAALDRKLTSVARGNLPPARVTAREYLGDIVNIQAIQAETAARTAQNDTALADELEFQRASISGVNMDEEMAHLLQLQQAYATSARIITAADEMLQELLNAKR